LVAETIHPASMCEGGGRGGEGGGRVFYYTYTYSKKKTVLRWSRAGRHCGCRNHVCVREEDARGREAGAHSTTPTYFFFGDLFSFIHAVIQLEKTVLRGSRAGRRCGCRKHPSCVYVLMCEGGGRGGREAGAHSTTPTETVHSRVGNA